MADLIDRDMTIYELEAFRESCIVNLLRMSFEDITDVVKGIPAVNRWIPCSERLPEVYEKVLTYSDDGIIHDNFRLNLRDGSVGWSQGWGITHWQPLPEPPEKE